MIYLPGTFQNLVGELCFKHSCMAVLITCCYFYFSQFYFFIRLLPIIIDFVLTLSYSVTL